MQVEDDYSDARREVSKLRADVARSKVAPQVHGSLSPYPGGTVLMVSVVWRVGLQTEAEADAAARQRTVHLLLQLYGAWLSSNAPPAPTCVSFANCRLGDDGVVDLCAMLSSVVERTRGETAPPGVGVDDRPTAVPHMGYGRATGAAVPRPVLWGRAIDLRGCCLSDVGAERLMAVFVRGARTAVVDLRGNSITEAGVVSMVEVLRGLDDVDHVIVGPDGKLEALGLPDPVLWAATYVCLCLAWLVSSRRC